MYQLLRVVTWLVLQRAHKVHHVRVVEEQVEQPRVVQQHDCTTEVARQQEGWGSASSKARVRAARDRRGCKLSGCVCTGRGVSCKCTHSMLTKVWNNVCSQAPTRAQWKLHAARCVKKKKKQALTLLEDVEERVQPLLVFQVLAHLGVRQAIGARTGGR